MSLSDFLIKPPLHNHNRSYTDSIRRLGGFDCTDNNDKTSSQNNNSNSGSGQHGNKDQAMSANTTTTTSAPSSSTSTPMDLHREDVRLVTFDNEHWDVPFLDKGKLAQIGFYYIGPQDTVKCHFCRVEIGKWEEDDDCFTEHSRWSPSCPLLRRQQTDNVPINAEELNQILPPITYDTCGLSGGGVLIRPNAYAERSFTPSAEHDLSREQQAPTISPSSLRSTPESVPEESGRSSSGGGLMSVGSSGNTSPYRFNNGVIAQQSHSPSSALVMEPTHGLMTSPQQPQPQMMAPQMYSGSSTSQSFFNPVTTPHLEIEANRLKTFKEWPIQLKMKPVELSDAGFFYTGMGDRVQCFSCGGGLKNWEDDDVAWEQHALWYPNCEYMKLIRGQKYIDAVQQVHRQKQQRRERGEDDEEEEGQDELSTSEEGEEEETGEDVLPVVAGRRVNGVRQRSPLEGTSNGGEVRKIARRRTSKTGSGSHPEADLSSAEAMLAVKSAKPSEVPETKLCKICYECEFNTAFIPCGHVVACAKCASAVTTCPMCREPFDSVTRIYFS